MASVTVTWVYFGNVSRMNSNINNNVTQHQINNSGIVGSTYDGETDLDPIKVTGNNVVTSNPASPYYPPTYNAGWGRPASDMSYTRPSGAQVNKTQVTGFMEAKFAITIDNRDGTTSVVEKSGVIIQMNNGDLFMRPALDTAAAWGDVNYVVDVKVTSAKPFPANTVPATVNFDPETGAAIIICFGRGTMIATERGEVAIEDLRIGDRVMTRDAGAQPVRWIGATGVSAARLDLMPNLRPIRIHAGALGDGMPSRDLVVSPQHRVLVRSRIARRMFDQDEVLVAAKHLLGLDGIEVAHDLPEVEYFHLLLDQHHILTSNGAETESLFLGPEARKAVGPGAWREIQALFPELADDGITVPAARGVAPGRMGRNLAARQARNRQALVLH